ncbi:MAG: cupin domain-containing protein [Acidimicrobiales bacterium]|nr:cupin domain-containing protein [Hyphomonadaceae bacterium]RZV42064.1 MAG: cupin domain-containing protein [Acidimicrobiales bacterium]
MPKIDATQVNVKVGTGYPEKFDKPCAGRRVEQLSLAGGLTQFGAYRAILPPGCWASQRHMHSAEDEFVYILTGNPSLIDDDGETILAPGDSCAHPAGDGNAHHLINKTDSEVSYLIVGSRLPETDHCQYPDVDLDLSANGTDTRVFSHKDGTPY